MLSDLIAALPPSPIIDIFNKAFALRSQGADLIDFSVGEPDFDTPAHICEAAISAIQRGDTRYTPATGSGTMKAAVAEKFLRDNGLQFEHSEIAVCSGAKPLLASVIQVILNPGDEAILPTPLWAPHMGMVRAVGGRPVLVDTSTTRFKLTAEALDAAITPRTKLLVICSPSNPVGAVYTSEELLLLADVLRRHPQVLVISDDLYEHIVFDGNQFATLAAVAPELRDRIMTLNGVSKDYAMTGWRIGFAGGPKWWIGGLQSLFNQTSGGPSSISQVAAVAALTGPQDFLREWAAIYQRRRDIALAGLAMIEGLRTEIPGGAFYLYPNCGALLGRSRTDGRVVASSTDLAEHFLDHGVAVVPGTGFCCDPYFRVSVATSDDNIIEGMNRLKLAVEALRE